MSVTPSKVMMIEIDSFMAPRVYEWARAGLLPNLGGLIERGVCAANCLATYPTIAATNRATVATGAWPGSHGVIEETTSGLDCLPVETLWKACQRCGRKSVVLRWSALSALPQPRPAESVVAGGEDDAEAFLAMLDRSLAQGVAKARKALAQPWEVCFLELDLMEGFYRRLPTGDGAEKEAYRRIDRALGEVLSMAPTHALVVVGSVHGVKPRGKQIDVAEILEQAGLLVRQPAVGTEQSGIAWARTKAVPRGLVNIVVNLRGREPDGIVEPGAEYEAVVQQVINALHDYTDLETSLKPINLAFRCGDIRILGLYGNGVGDVVYALDPRFGPEWGPLLPVSRVEGGDLRGLFIMAGPGVKKSTVLERNVWLTDVVPTVCYLAELPIPRSCEGAVLYQALEDPDAKADELDMLRARLAELKQIVERPAMMC